jgi:hypothetical protein
MTVFQVRQVFCGRTFATAATAFLLCSGALTAQTLSGQLSLEEEPDFPLATPVEAVQGTPEPLNLKGKTDYFLKSAFSTESLGRIALTTSLTSIGGTSEDWGTGTAAYGRRIGSRYAGHFAGSAVRFGVGALRGEDPRFYRSGKEGFWPRTGFVLSRTFVTKMDDGSTSIAAGRLAGTITSNTLQSYMRAQNDDPLKRGFTNAGISIGGDIAIRMVREFWPDIKKSFRR